MNEALLTCPIGGCEYPIHSLEPAGAVVEHLERHYGDVVGERKAP